MIQKNTENGQKVSNWGIYWLSLADVSVYDPQGGQWHYSYDEHGRSCIKQIVGDTQYYDAEHRPEEIGIE